MRDVCIQNVTCFLSPAHQFFHSTPPTVLPPNFDGAIIAHTVSANHNNGCRQTPCLSHLLQLPQPLPCPSPSLSIIYHVVDCCLIIVVCCLRCHPIISSRAVGCCFCHFVFGIIMLPPLLHLLLMITTTFFRLVVELTSAVPLHKVTGQLPCRHWRHWQLQTRGPHNEKGQSQ